MAIAKRPKSTQSDIDVKHEEQAAASFIAGAAATETPGKRERKIPVLVRFDPQMLVRVDQAAKRRGVSRSAWIHFMVSRALDTDES